MKTSDQVKKIAVITGLTLGAFTLAALASAPWTPPPPGGPPGNNVDAPINLGSLLQTKTGPISVGGLGITSSNFIFKPSVAAVTAGYVLTAQGTDGTVAWGPGGGSVTNTATTTAPQGIRTFVSTSGTTNWVAPAGVTRARIRVWGGGGGGGAYNGSATHVGGGGGAGGYAEGSILVTPGSTYTVTVGAGGNGGTAGSNDANRCGSPGNTSKVAFGGTTLIEANGGGYGHSGCGDGEAYYGGNGGSYDIHSNINAFGITGGDGAIGSSQGGQAEGGDSPMGGQGTSAWAYSAPHTPGGGGGGGVSASGEKDGYYGARGQVVIEY